MLFGGSLRRSFEIFAIFNSTKSLREQTKIHLPSVNTL